MGDKEPDPHEGPIESRLSHTGWKFRRAACEDLNKLFLSATTNQPFDQYSSYFKKIIEDKNISAKEAGLECFLTWLDKAENPQRNINLISSLATETFGARAKAKELGLKAILSFIEVLPEARFVPAAGEAFVNNLYEVATTSKNAKIAALAINTIKTALIQFGPKVIPLKFILKEIVKFFEVSDNGIREEAMALAVEVYRWAGEAIKPTFAGLRPAQLKDLNEKCAALPPSAQNPPKPEKQLRYQLSIEPEPEVAASGGGGPTSADDDTPAADNAFDPWEAADPVDILSKLDAKFQNDLEAKKWSDRRDAFKLLITLTEPPTVRIAPGNYGGIRASIIKGISKDVNIVVSETAANAAAALSKALRGGFNEEAKSIIPSLLEKFKATKTTALAAFDETLDQLVQPDKKWSIGIQDILDSLIGALQNKLAQVKEKTCQYILRLVAKTNRNALAAALKAPVEQGPLVAKLVDLVDTESDEKVREAGYKLLAEITGKVGEKFMSPYYQKLDSIKINKLKGMYPENMFQGVIGPAVKPAAAAAPAAAKPKPQSGNVAPKPATAGTGAARGTTATATANKPATVAAGNKPTAASAARTAPAQSVSKPAATPKTAATNVVEEPKPQNNSNDNVVEEESMSSDVALEVTKHDILSKLKSTDWKQRKESLEKLETILRKHIENNFATMHSEAPKPAASYAWLDKVVLALRDRIKDNQTNLVPIALNTLGTVAESVPPKSNILSKYVRDTIPIVIGLLKNAKPTRDAAVTVLDRWVAAAGLESFIPILPEHFTANVTAVRKELLEWFALNAFKEDVLTGGNNASLSKKMEILVRPSLACLDDRSAEVPKLAEQVIAEIVSHVGWAPYIAELKRITNQSTKAKIEPVLKRVKQNLSDSVNSYNEIVQNLSGGNTSGGSSNSVANVSVATNPTVSNHVAATTTAAASSPSRASAASRTRTGTGSSTSTTAAGTDGSRTRTGTGSSTPGRSYSSVTTSANSKKSDNKENKGLSGAAAATGTPNAKPSPLELNIANNTTSPKLNYTSITNTKPTNVTNPSATVIPETDVIVARAATTTLNDLNSSVATKPSNSVTGSQDSKLEQRYAGLATGDTNTVVKLVRIMCSDMSRSDTPFISISEYLTLQLTKHLANYLAQLQPHQNQRVSLLGAEGRALTYIFTALHFILQRPALAMVVSFDILKSLLKLVLEADSFADSSTDDQPQPEQQQGTGGSADENVTVAQLIAKFTTRIVLDVIKNTDYNASWTSLMGLLLSAFEGDFGAGVGDKVKYVKLIVGSLQRMIEVLKKGGAGSNIENVNIDQILYDMHQFVEKTPVVLSTNVKTSEGSFINEALCTKVKRVLEAAMSNLVSMKGRKISSHFTLLPVDKYPPVFVITYISKLINAKYGGGDKPEADNEGESSAAAMEFKDEVVRSEELKNIFKKIGNAETEQEGMKELYYFRKKNAVEVDKFLEGRTNRFQGYIKEALINLSKTLEPNNSSTSSSTTPNSSFGSNPDTHNDEKPFNPEAVNEPTNKPITTSTSSAGGWEEKIKAMRERFPSAYQDTGSSSSNSNSNSSSSNSNLNTAGTTATTNGGGGEGISGIYSMRGTSSSTAATLELLKEKARSMGLGLGGSNAGTGVEGGSGSGSGMSASLPVTSSTTGGGTSGSLDDLRQRFRNLQRKREEEEQQKKREEEEERENK
eukprot:TRINITY_DN2649_c0_g1_i1.p1 TRINITY_DN2649_c0_g1~~TRINITY_DN2649_c0_g1_i1.p1  ORF type:complete len:1686 (+),score=552.57 TRINITY_DN2649_c0_g1_i1:94-5151(+)